MTTGTAVAGPARRRGGTSPLRVAVVTLAVPLGAVVAAPVAALVPPRLALAALAAAVLVAVGYAHPPLAAYLLLAATPLTAGFARDAFLPLLRPHEALGLLLGAGVMLRALVQVAQGHRLRLRWGSVDTAILLMAVTSSVLPLLWMAARGLTPSRDDVLYALTLWKFYGVFLLVRASVRTERQVSRCLWICLGAGALLAVVATLQSLFPGVADLVNAVYPVEGGAGPALGRGTAMLGSSIAVGDVMAFDLAICLGWALRPSGHRRLLVALSLLFGIGGLGSGQFSGAIAIAVAVLVVAVLTQQVGRLLLASVPVCIVAVVLLSPVIQERLNDIDAATGLPQSWYVRLENLRRYVWPQVFSWPDWLFGVRPASVLRVNAPWGNEIYIESGQTWLLWAGGVPFALAYLYFTWVAVRATARVALSRADAIGVAATASVASLVVDFVLMTFDPHLTMRGTADLLFALLALATVRARTGTDDRSERPPRDSTGPHRIDQPPPGRTVEQPRTEPLVPVPQNGVVDALVGTGRQDDAPAETELERAHGATVRPAAVRTGEPATGHGGVYPLEVVVPVTLASGPPEGRPVQQLVGVPGPVPAGPGPALEDDRVSERDEQRR